jgi:4-methylaminobutanoate oxidase (formaldehyde-forming)
MRSALHRTPCLETADIKMLLNGPESFTPDGNFIIGEAPELRHYFVCAGFNSAGIANAGGAGRLMAEWMVQGAPSVDVWDVDIRRFAPFTSNRRALAERTVETLGLHYAMRWPRQELQTVRPLRTSPLYDALAAKGAVFGSKNGWERVNYFKPVDAPAARDTLGTPDWLPWVQAEQAATREAVALYDQTSFGKLLVQGPDALTLLQHLCMRHVDTPVGQMVYTPMLNDRGGHESDLTLLRLASDAFLLITGSAQVTRDMDWIRRHMVPHSGVYLTDVTAMYSVLSLMGPMAPELMARVSPDDVSRQALPLRSTREIDLGHARVRVVRMSYVGGLGFELYVPIEMTRHVYQTLHTAGLALGLRDAGYYALDALRTERARRAWGAELGPGETPLDARMLSALPADKSPPFKGQQALRDQWPATSHIKLVRVLATQPDPYLWGGEPLLIDGQTVGEITSVGWGHEAGACVGMAYLRGDWAARVVVHQPASAMLWGEPVPVLLHDLTPLH